MISITEEAKQYLDSMIGFGLHGRYARVSVESGGCSGYQYSWDLVDDAANGTLVEDILVIDNSADSFIEGCEIDMVEGFAGSSLVVKNPKAFAQCGCGESFGI